MAYNDECSNAGISCTRINRWANPAVNYNSAPTGVAIGSTNPANEAFGFARFACVVSNSYTASPGLNQLAIQEREDILKVKDFSVYPNPAKDEINISIKNNEQYTFKIANSLGQTVLTSDKATINLSALGSGEYFLNIYSDKNTLAGSKKFIIK